MAFRTCLSRLVLHFFTTLNVKSGSPSPCGIVGHAPTCDSIPCQSLHPSNVLLLFHAVTVPSLPRTDWPFLFSLAVPPICLCYSCSLAGYIFYTHSCTLCSSWCMDPSSLLFDCKVCTCSSHMAPTPKVLI